MSDRALLATECRTELSPVFERFLDGAHEIKIDKIANTSSENDFVPFFKKRISREKKLG